MCDGIILYGPPASGKDTVTAQLRASSSAYAHFDKLKVDGERTGHYRPATDKHLTNLRKRGLIIHEVTRYAATYAIDITHLDELFTSGHIPIVHLGQLTGIHTLQQYRHHWLSILLWCPKMSPHNDSRNADAQISTNAQPPGTRL